MRKFLQVFFVLASLGFLASCGSDSGGNSGGAKAAKTAVFGLPGSFTSYYEVDYSDDVLNDGFDTRIESGKKVAYLTQLRSMEDRQLEIRSAFFIGEAAAGGVRFLQENEMKLNGEKILKKSFEKTCVWQGFRNCSEGASSTQKLGSQELIAQYESGVFCTSQPSAKKEPPVSPKAFRGLYRSSTGVEYEDALFATYQQAADYICTRNGVTVQSGTGMAEIEVITTSALPQYPDGAAGMDAKLSMHALLRDGNGALIGEVSTELISK